MLFYLLHELLNRYLSIYYGIILSFHFRDCHLDRQGNVGKGTKSFQFCLDAAVSNQEL